MKPKQGEIWLFSDYEVQEWEEYYLILEELPQKDSETIHFKAIDLLSGDITPLYWRPSKYWSCVV